MSADVGKLRESGNAIEVTGFPAFAKLLRAAADELEALRAENEKLRARLENPFTFLVEEFMELEE